MTINGNPPSLEWISIDRLEVDPAYQRATDGDLSRRIIASMVKAWEWTLCQPLVVSRRPDGRMMILDGQHRHAGAVARGDLPHLPCVIVSGQDEKGEAETFIALNTRRQRLSEADKFNGMLAAGDADAKAMADLLAETGWRQVRAKNLTSCKPGALMCAPMLVKELRNKGEAVMRNALTALREAYSDKPVQNSATLLKALMLIYSTDRLTGVDPDLFIEALGAVEPGDWEDCKREIAASNPMLSRIEALAEAMLNNYHDYALDAAA